MLLSPYLQPSTNTANVSIVPQKDRAAAAYWWSLKDADAARAASKDQFNHVTSRGLVFRLITSNMYGNVQTTVSKLLTIIKTVFIWVLFYPVVVNNTMGRALKCGVDEGGGFYFTLVLGNPGCLGC